MKKTLILATALVSLAAAPAFATAVSMDAHVQVVKAAVQQVHDAAKKGIDTLKAAADKDMAEVKAEVVALASKHAKTPAGPDLTALAAKFD